MNILETHALTKRFGGLLAVKQLDITVQEGYISSIIGPNGAGKTTFLIVLRASINLRKERSFSTTKQ